MGVRIINDTCHPTCLQFPLLQLSADSTGEETAKLLSEVFGRLCSNPLWHEALRSLLEGIDEVCCTKIVNLAASLTHGAYGTWYFNKIQW